MIASATISPVDARRVLVIDDALAAQAPKLRSAGFRIAIDDFGTGPSGLSTFGRLTPEFTKLDRSMLAGLDSDPKKEKIVRAMYAMCAVLGVPIIAEGIETPGERQALIALGADFAQGNEFEAPASSFVAPVF